MADKPAIHGGRKACKTPWPERRQFDARERKAVLRLLDRAIKTGQPIRYNGPEEESYCEEFASFLGGGYADGVNSGSSAVYVGLMALRIKAFSEVICGPVSDPGGIMPIALAGCIPIIADSEPGGFNISPASIERRITKRTGAIVVTHVAGLPADMGAIMRIARRKGVPVLEDCAQAHGAEYKGRMVGTFGNVAAFSTMHGKHHTTGGQGGIVFTRNKNTHQWVRRYADRGKAFGLKGATGNVVCSHNMNMDELAACIGRVQLRKLPGTLRRRRESARFLIEACRKELKAVRIVEGLPDTLPAYWFLLVQLDLARLRVDKGAFVEALRAEGVPCNLSYLHLFTRMDWYRNRSVFTGTDYPWGSPLYQGDPNREYPIPNVLATDRRTFHMPWNERITRAHAREILSALRKVEAAYLR